MVKRSREPWIRADGYIDLGKLPIESALHNIIEGNDHELRDRCGALVVMYDAGKKEAAIFLYGLIAQNYSNIMRKEIIVKALGDIETKESANILFRELKNIESSNTTRGYIDAILKSLSRFPKDLVGKGFEDLLNDKKWSYKMKSKFEDILVNKILAV